MKKVNNTNYTGFGRVDAARSTIAGAVVPPAYGDEMAKSRAGYRCTECGVPSPRWAGRCAGCGSWNTVVEEVVARRSPIPLSGPCDRPQPIAEVGTAEWTPVATGVPELDRVLGGGLVPGSVTMCGGEPGIGKSTLLLQVAAAVSGRGRKVLYVSGEESKPQIRLRAERLGALRPKLWLATDSALPDLLAHVAEVEPDLLIVDSVQAVHDPAVSSAPGSVIQVRDCAHRLVQEAKARGLATVLVGHVTKEGGLAGPRTLEHLVDTVLSFEGDRHHALRMLRALKHRFGSTLELGLFEMSDEGLRGVADPSELFLADRRKGVAGSVVVPTIDGHRPLLVELQALVVPTHGSTPRRSAQGVDGGRLALLLAILARRARLPVTSADVYALAVGGARVAEPGADLGVALAVGSAVRDQPIADDLVAIGEVGLGGELRQVGQTPRRLAEAARLGFRRAIVPAAAPVDTPGVQVLRAGTIRDAIRLAVDPPDRLRAV